MSSIFEKLNKLLGLTSKDEDFDDWYRSKSVDRRLQYYLGVKSDSRTDPSILQIVLEIGLNDPDEDVVDRVIHLYFNDPYSRFGSITKEQLATIIKVYFTKDVRIRNEILSKIGQLLSKILYHKAMREVLMNSLVKPSLEDEDLYQSSGVKTLLKRMAGFKVMNEYLDDLITNYLIPNDMYRTLKSFYYSTAIKKENVTRILLRPSNFGLLKQVLDDNDSSYYVYYVLMIFRRILENTKSAEDAETRSKFETVRAYLLDTTAEYYQVSDLNGVSGKIVQPMLLAYHSLKLNDSSIFAFISKGMFKKFTKLSTVQKLRGIYFPIFTRQRTREVSQLVLTGLANFILAVGPDEKLYRAADKERLGLASQLGYYLDNAKFGGFSNPSMVDLNELVQNVPALRSKAYLRLLLSQRSKKSDLFREPSSWTSCEVIVKLYILYYKTKGLSFQDSLYSSKIFMPTVDLYGDDMPLLGCLEAPYPLDILLNSSHQSPDIHRSVFRFILLNSGFEAGKKAFETYRVSDDYKASEEYIQLRQHYFPSLRIVDPKFQELPLILVTQIIQAIYRDQTIRLSEKFQYSLISKKVLKVCQLATESIPIHVRERFRSTNVLSLIHNKQAGFYHSVASSNQSLIDFCDHYRMMLDRKATGKTHPSIKTLDVLQMGKVLELTDFPNLTDVNLTVTNLRTQWTSELKSKYPSLRVYLTLMLTSSSFIPKKSHTYYESCNKLVLTRGSRLPSHPFPVLKILEICEGFTQVSSNLLVFGNLMSGSTSIETLFIRYHTRHSLSQIAELLKDAKVLKILRLVYQRQNFHEPPSQESVNPDHLREQYSKIFKALGLNKSIETITIQILEDEENDHLPDPIIFFDVDTGPFKKHSNNLFYRSVKK